MPADHGERLTFEVVTTTGRASALEIRVHSRAVEVWRGGECRAVFDRDHLRAWFGALDSCVRVKDVTFKPARWVDRAGRAAISMLDIQGWTLSPRTQQELRARL